MNDATVRQADLRHVLIARRQEIQDDVHSRIRDVRADRPDEVGDELEHSDADAHGDIEFALLQMKAETLKRIDEALVRLDAGEYGCCFECDDQISDTRLRALPFAVRCKACEERREQGQWQARRAARPRGFSLFPDLVTP